MEHLFAPAEWKAAGDAGTFSGYASIFGNIDLGGDIVERGAFKEIVTNSEGKIVTLWQHDTRTPLGVASVKQDDKGLAFDGSLVMEDAKARTALAHMKAGSVRGMSIGFDILAGGAEVMESGVRKLLALKLWEISIVTFGMNPLALVQSAKARAKQCATIRDFEDLLRDVAGFSNVQAKLLASGGWRTLQQARDESGGGGEKEDAAEVVKYLRSVSAG